MTRLVWLRNDLRVLDNPALYYACQHANENSCQSREPVKVIFCATPLQWEKHNEAPAQLALRAKLLNNLAVELAELGIALEILQSTDFQQLPKQLSDYCLRHRIRSVWVNKQSWLNEVNRDIQVEQNLKKQDITLHQFSDEFLVTKNIVNKTSQPYRVFTPWYRQWIKHLEQLDISLLPTPIINNNRPIAIEAVSSLSLATDYREDIWPASGDYVVKQLIRFCNDKAEDYATHRDFPAIKGTSLLSPYLAVGAISIRQCYVYLQQSFLQKQADYQSKTWQENIWLKELGWREFYRYLMINTPDLAKGHAFNANKEPKWLDAPDHFLAWQQGQTGFPIVDAAMKQLLQTGWMHNRLRMIVASFLCKLLLIDWRKGETFFMLHLIDGDFSSNNGGWQWSSSVGCDAAPWFRIFNPTRQSETFDKNGAFIRKFLPELNTLDDKDIHCPSTKQRETLGYPQPIIDYKQARARTLNWLA